jgi:hypothetical protein
MSGNIDAAADRFYRELVKNSAPPKTPVPTPPAPQKPVILPVVDKDAEFRKRYNDELEAIVEFEHHPEWFDESDAGVENAQRVLAWIQQHRNGYASRSTVAEGVAAIKDTLTPLRQPQTPPPLAIRVPKAATQPAIQPAPVAPPAPPPEPVDDLPPVPDYVRRRIGKNPFLTPKNVRDIPSAVFSELYHSAVGPAFKARVDAILRKAQGLR